MRRNNTNMKNVARKLAACCLLLFAFAGNAAAQYDSPFVIKKDGNYLAHVGTYVPENDTTIWNLQNDTAFNPATCLWYSGPDYNPTGYTHNYYFEDDAHNLRFLAAPLEPEGELSLSASLPSVSLLRNTDQVYYFYNWDPETHLNGVPEGGGVARGKRYYVDTEAECVACGHGATWHETDTENHTFQCWEVYWIENVGNEWKLSSASSYNITPNGAHYRKVTITEHEKNIVSGGLTSMTVPSVMNSGENSLLSAPVGSPYSYIPAYTNYVFLENGSTSVHNYWGNTDHLDATPTQQNNVNIGNKSYEWTISGDGVEYLSFAEGSDVNTTTAEAPTLYYRVPNNTGHKTATITVTVTYTDANDEQTTQTRSATVLVKTPCQNPSQAAAPVVTYTGVTVSWVHTADSYTVSWKKASDSDWESVTVGNVTSYTLMGLEYETEYQYKITTECGTNEPIVYNFTTSKEPGLMVVGNIFGGGRMANVTGNTEVVIVNCDSVGGIFGGNDIAGTVEGNNGATITLGVDAGGSYASYGTTTGPIRVSSVYGGGNGYYAYDGSSFEPATSDTYTVPAGGSVTTQSQTNAWDTPVWTNEGADTTLTLPSIKKAAVTVTNDYVKIDSVFGGAKNAYLYTNAGSFITVNGGTIFAVFGGNNVGGGQGHGWHNVTVNATTTNLTPNIANTPTAGYGRDFGIRYLFGGGNKVYGSTTDIEIFGGQTDNVFGGGNSADVYAANVTVNCALGAYSSDYTYGNTYTNAIQTYEGGDITPKPTGNGDGQYDWNGKGIYNVRNLYGGNNMEHMASVPTVTLTSGSVGTVYGGGNAGDMLASSDGTIDEDGDNVSDISFDYSTKVILNSANIIVDYVYGGCRMSNVDYSTWVQIQDGHVGTVFGGCNVSGDVGSTRVNPSASGGMEYQEVQGGTYVEASGGTVYKNIFAGGNGFYHCNENFQYINGINYTADENYVGMLVPTHNETHAIVKTGATVKGNVYAGGNLAPVGFQDNVANYFPSFPVDAVGWAVVHIYGGTIEGNVFGGGNMADIYGSNDVMVAGGTIAAVYGGNDRTGQVGEFSNRVLPRDYSYATDGSTNLITPIDVHAYVRIVGTPNIQEVYGGGNGDYDYEHGDEVVHQYCDENESGPIQSNTFVDINIDGGALGGHIGTVYGGGDGVTASGFIYVFMNINEPSTPEDHVNVNTVFGGNNKGDLEIVPNIILLHGQVGTVYGGCNEGAMTANPGITVGDYQNIGSYVHLRNSYSPIGNPAAPTATPDIKISNAIYGGCRMNGVTNNSLVLVEGGNFSAIPIFGGSDISGTVSGISQVVVDGGAVGTAGNIYGGGNGDYDYTSGTYSGLTPPNSNNSRVDVISGAVLTGVYGGNNAKGNIVNLAEVNITGGTIGVSGTPANIHGGGYGAATTTDGDVQVNIGATDGAATPTYSGTAVIWGDVYGGSALGEVSASDKVTNVNFYKGTINGDVYGGGLGDETHAAAVSGDVEVNVYGGVFNSATGTPGGGNIYGCNNANGSPSGNVNVNIYATDHGDDYEHNLYPTAPSGGWTVANLATNADFQTYAINQVFGGGNQAAYIPAADKTATVHVYNCDNTIYQVFGGGNAADVGSSSLTTNTNVIIDGGRFHQVYGGGNGYSATSNHTDPEQPYYNPGANIYGTASSTIYAGLIDEIFGGANQWGSVEVIDLHVSSSNACADEVYGKVFGCANEAPYNKSVTTTIECGVGTIGELYGGSNQASIGDPSNHNTGVDVTLNLYGGGPYNNVFAGSKGATSKAADIYGNVTLNLYGGNVINAFGGSDVNGNITGNITVNVLDYETTNCGLDLTNVYGASNATAYNPDEGYKDGPVINVMHIKQTEGIRGNVFGGGNQGAVTANPTVNVGYDDASMSTLIPEGYLIAEASRRAYVTGNVYGGGNEAGVTSPTVNIISGTVATDVYGGCNTNGTVTGDIAVNLTGGTVGNDVFGGGKGNATATQGNVTVTINGGAVTRDVYGGSALGQVNDALADLTKVWLKSGTVGGNLYGGGMGQAEIADNGQLNGNVEVHINGGTVTGSVFGCNNYNEQPAGTVKVYINETSPGTMNIGGNVYGGGNVAYYDGTPEVYIQNGTVTHKVFGGGNNISTANKGVGGSNVVMSGGTVLGGIFGGCNTDGDVVGDSHVTLINGTIGSTSARASIHGGGYGESTGVLGNVTVDFGQESTSHNDGLILYGDLYGGSALGNVNDNSSDITTVNVLNGIIQGIGNDPANTGYYGNVFGGGLGDESHPAAVNGVVHVNIGTETANGLASLVRCNVYGCNNQKGSPKDNVYVDVWGTTHTTTDEVDYYDFDRTYAIYQVFGGGNQAHYHAENNSDYLKRTYVTVHNCDNTIRYVYGGGNAADADGVETIILGGRFEEIYGGGNGRVTPANITGGGIGLNVVAGNVNFLFEGSNKEGENVGGHWYKPAASSDCLGGLFVDSYFFGTNEAELYGDLTNMINCADAGDFEYRYVYAGSRWGIVYGDINLMVGGGTIENLFGGCRGYSDYSADVRRFPTKAEIVTDQALPEGQRKYSAQLLNYMGYPSEFKTELAGHGGNINLVVTGGTIGNIFGGCDVKGNVEGNISVTVSETDNACPLFVGNVYGASNQWYYKPEHSDIHSPVVKILKGTIGGTHPDLPVNNIYGAPATEYEGNVFGGGNQGDITSQPRVIIGDGTTGTSATPVTVKGNVYGGGNRGDITGSPQVVVVPVRHTLNYSDGSGGSISVTDSQYQSVSSGDEIGEGIDVSIIATPSDYAHTFTAWAVSSGDAIIAEPTASSTTLTMGTGNATITASFAAASAYTLSWSAPTGGTFTVTGFNGTVNSDVSVAQGVTFTLAATPDMTHKFKQWTVTGGASVASTQSATTTFTMGSADATITAEFETVATHILTFTSTEGGSCTVTTGNVTSGTSIGEGAVLNIVATASSGFAFSNWTVVGSGSVANPTSPNTTFTMGTDNATLTAHFVPTHALTINAATNGTIRVTTGLGQEVTSGAAVGEGAKLNLKATPAPGYAFNTWAITGTGASVENNNVNLPITTFTMGTEDSSISASFITAHTLTVEEPVNGTVKLTGVLNQNMSSPANIGEDVVISIQAIHDEGYVFNTWEVVSGNGTIGNPTQASTTFTMRTQNTIIRAIFDAQ